MDFNGILPLVSFNAGCDYHRIILPFQHMGLDLLSKFRGKNVDELLEDTKLVIFNRTPHQRLDKLLDLRAKKHFKILVDIDDFWILYPKHYMHSWWVKNEMGKQMIEAILVADAVTCTTEILADKIYQYNKNVHVIPNAIPFGQYQFTENKTESDKLRFVYAGGISHFWDIQELKIPFQKITENQSLRDYEMILAGFNDQNEESKKDWGKIERSFTLNGKLKNYKRQMSLPLTEYMHLYDNSDIALAPLETNYFNRFKSNLKIIEAGCKWNPIICSELDPYTCEKNKSVLMTANNAREWYDHIKYCIQNPSFVKEKGEQLGKYVRENYDLTKVNEYRTQLYNNLIS